MCDGNVSIIRLWVLKIQPYFNQANNMFVFLLFFEISQAVISELLWVRAAQSVERDYGERREQQHKGGWRRKEEPPIL